MWHALDAAAVREALAAQSATGVPWLGLAMGLERVDAAAGNTELRARAPVGVTELAVIADFALGAALRTRLGPTTLLATLTLTLQVDDFAAASEANVRAHAEPTHGAVAPARGEVLVGGLPIGACLATFALPTHGSSGMPPLPWERSAAKERRGSAAASPTAAHGDRKRSHSDGSAEAPTARAGERSLGDALVAPDLTRGGDGAAHGRLDASPLLANRAGQVQGGALAGLAVAAARTAAEQPAAGPVSAHILFLRPAEPAALDVHADVLRAGRRAAFVRVDVNQGGSLVASAQVVLGGATSA